MPTFRYHAKSAPGQTVDGVVEAENRLAALGKLSDLGYFPTSVEENIAHSPIASGKISQKDLALFTRQLADLLDAGLPLLKGVRVATEQTSNGRLAAILREVGDRVEGGASLADALRAHGEIFTPVFVGLVHAGEVGAFLGTALERLADLAERQDELRARIQTSLAYPGLILLTGAGTVLFLLVYVVPKLATVFEEMGQELPWVTRFLVEVGRGAASPLGILMFGGAVTALGLTRKKWKAWFASRSLDRIPVWGPLAKKAALARFGRTLSVLLSSGVPILDSLQISSEVLGHADLSKHLLAARTRVGEGESLAESLRAAGGFPPFVSNMIAVGEEGRSLGRSLDKVAATCERDCDRALKVFTALLEPLLILGVGTVIAFIVLSMLLPIFQMSTFVR
jgi:type II secretory pathway component PulF